MAWWEGVGDADTHWQMCNNSKGSNCSTRAMSEEQLKAFIEAVKADAGLKEQLKAAGNTDAVVAIAKAAGFLISAEELKAVQAEISEEELEGVAGGGCAHYNQASVGCTN